MSIPRTARTVRTYAAVALTTAQSGLAYPLETFARTGFMFVVIFIFIQLWSVTFRLSGQASIAGYDFRRMVWYLVLTESITLSVARVFDVIDQQVKSGELAYTLAKPYSYPLFHFAQFMGGVLLALPANLLTGAALALVFAGPPSTNPAAWPVIALAVLLAVCLHFAVGLSIGLLAFWFEDTNAFYWIYQKTTFVLGGLFLPLSLFPSTLRAVAQRLPFSAIAYAPARLSAQFDAGLAAGTLVTQLGWLLLLGGVAALVYRSGVRRVNMNGG